MIYPLRVRVQRRDGHIYKKYPGIGLVKEARFIAASNEGRPLDDNERVFFKDGNRENLEPDNVVPIHFSEVRFKYLPRARVIYMPPKVTA